VAAPEKLRQRLRGLSTNELLAANARFRPGNDLEDVKAATRFAIRSLTWGYQAHSEEIAELDAHYLHRLVVENAPGLTSLAALGTHPFLPSTPGNDVEIVAPAPEDIHSTDPDGDYLEIRLTATDSNGLSRTVTRKLAPHTVDVVFQSRPAELDLVVNGHKFDDATRTFMSWEGYRLNVDAPSPQTTPSRVTYSFAYWSDGNVPQHAIVTGTAPSSYTATFKTCTKTGTSAGETLTVPRARTSSAAWVATTPSMDWVPTTYFLAAAVQTR
jgi:hypothetical protein